MQIRHGLYLTAWPFLAPVAAVYRKVFLKKTRVVAVVGSLGKSTTVRAAAAALKTALMPHAHRNYLSYVGGALLCAKPIDPYVVIEVGVNRPGQMRQYASVLKPDMAIVTSIASEHMGSFGSLEATRSEKSRMVAALPSSGIAVLNGDDPNVVWMKSRTKARVATFGMGPDNDVRASDIVLDWPGGMRFVLHSKAGAWPVRTKLFGRHMVYPLLAASAAALSFGIDPAEFIPRLEALGPTHGRMQIVPLASGAHILRDDYKSTLETIHASLDTFAAVPAKRKIVVLGDVSEPPGNQGRIYGDIGARAGVIASEIILVGSSFQRYAAGIARAGFPRKKIIDAGKDILLAADALRGIIASGDAVLIKGRDTQRLDRITLALEGRKVACGISLCFNRMMTCEDCPMLERGWDGCVNMMEKRRKDLYRA
jgi:UDP-N-acetylmuramoyl-tripeptide--D-alanyl-D-alanine ligase